MSTDFTSASFLGFRHAHGDLAPWACLTTGRPPALDDKPDGELTRGAARLLGTSDVLVRRTTLHALIDVLAAFASNGSTILVDEGAYPIVNWATGATTSAGARVVHYRHHDYEHAASQCRRVRQPVAVVTDGWCASCSRPAPLRELASISRRHHARIVIDDSLAVGVLGDRTAHSTGFGIGGTGTLEWLGAHEPGPVVVASLAKAYGVPLALVGGPRGVIRNIGHHEMSTIHASGPTAADRAALRGVLETDRTFLAAKRARLEQRTQQLRHLLQRHGLRPIGLPFPFVQAECDVDPVDLVRTLRRYGCHTLAITRRCGTEVDRAVLGCALRSDHSDTAIASLDRAIGRALRELRTGAVA